MAFIEIIKLRRDRMQSIIRLKRCRAESRVYATYRLAFEYGKNFFSETPNRIVIMFGNCENISHTTDCERRSTFFSILSGERNLLSQGSKVLPNNY
ncbi:hypothetical protein TNCV_1275181 [Trichonephila clavipes]|nr:hypothetical protein TNCV_1275181 [Trichonephila clavipes]